MIKIVLLGDIHFGKFARNDEFSLKGIKRQDESTSAVSLKNGIKDVLRHEKIDYLFVAGDLTSTGAPIEFDGCYKAVMDISKDANINEKNVIISLGNHDVDWRVAKISSDDIEDIDLKKQNQDYYQKVAANVVYSVFEDKIFSEKGPSAFTGVIEKDDIIIVVLNSGMYCGPDDYIAHGKIGEDQLVWLSKIGEKYKKSDSWKILLIHHHPYSYPHPAIVHDISVLEEGSKIVKIAGESGFNIICHGHRHHPKAQIDHRNEWMNPITFICTGSFSVNANHRGNGEIPNCFHILELHDKEKIVKLKNYEYTASEGWGLISNYCLETPIDGIMCFSRPYDFPVRRDKLLDIVDALKKKVNFPLPAWDSLPLELKTLSYGQLNELVENTLKKQYDIYGKYPDNVALLRR
jgi:3',5'-cyclic AMP phosphodiesterase CpdA